jgi:hypothetical protein
MTHVNCGTSGLRTGEHNPRPSSFNLCWRNDTSEYVAADALNFVICSKPVEGRHLLEHSRCWITPHRYAWSAGFRPLRVLQLAEPLLRPAPGLCKYS